MQRMKLADIKVTPRARKDLGDTATLAKSISEVGLLHPVVVSKAGELIAGLRRLDAVRTLGWHEVPVTVVDLDNPALGELAENTERKDLTPSEQLDLADLLETRIREEAALRRAHSAKASANFAEGETRVVVARKVGRSHASLKKVRDIVDAAREDPERWGPLQATMDRTGKVNGVHQLLKKQRQFDAIAKGPIPLPVGPFSCLVIDPPWPYEVRSEDVTHRGNMPYPPMSMAELKEFDLPVTLAADDAICWLWTTNAFMEEAHQLMREWGFQTQTILTWEKPGLGMGNWLRNTTEHCLLGVKGSPVWVNTKEPSCLHAASTRHSAKPDEFYALVEKLCPGNKVELFSRRRRPGWAVWGDEVAAEESVAV